MQKPFSPSAQSNRQAILDALRTELKPGDRVLEIGSGTGQHVCHFASNLPQVRWQPSELPELLPGMKLWLDEAACENVAAPVALDIMADPWPDLEADACLTVNTLHIVSAPAVERFFAGCAGVLADGGKLCVYGPFIFDGQHISESNARFSLALQERDPASGVRDVADLNRLAQAQGFKTARPIALPTNNHMLVFAR